MEAGTGLGAASSFDHESTSSAAVIDGSVTPRLSILVPVWDPSPSLFRRTIRSILEQSSPDFQLVIVDDGSTSAELQSLLDDYERIDGRIVIRKNPSNRGIVPTLNLALEAASGNFIAVVDHDDLLPPQAVERCFQLLDANASCDLLYTDEAWIDPKDRKVGDFLKPDWSPERLRSQMYTNHLSLYRRDLVIQLGGFRSGFDGSQDYDLALRVAEVARRIVHLPEVLYYWRIHEGQVSGSSNSAVYSAAKRAIEEHCQRVGIDGWVEQTDQLGSYRVHRRITESPLVSIVIPTRGSEGKVWGEQRTFVVEALRSITSKSTYPNVEFVVVADESTPSNVMRDLQHIGGKSLRVLNYRLSFNYSHKMNLGVLASSGEYVILLNDDVEVISPDWIETLLGLAREPDVGITGCMLYFEDGNVQHAGHIYQDGYPHHIGYGWQADAEGPARALMVNRECSGVTAACAMLKRDDYLAVGGLSRDYAFSFNDVDLSLKIREAGKRIVWTPWAKLYHFESQTREEGVAARELDHIRRRWGRVLDGSDPYWRDSSASA
jgi:glycosyltransferase involved in cell wall biosynthesis